MTKEKAIARLQSLCNRSEHCEFDLNRKMMTWGLSSSDRNEILEYLRENRLVDDLRFAKAFANDKARFSSWGERKIQIELQKRKIGYPLIKEALQSIELSVWKDALLKCAESKSKNLDLIGEDSYENSQKLYRYLILRGFSSLLSSKAVNLMKKRQKNA